MTVNIKSVKLSDVNIMDVTVKEFCQFMNELAEEMPAVFQQIIKRSSNELEVESSEQTTKETGS